MYNHYFLKNKNVIVYGAGSAFHWFYEIFYLLYNIKPIIVIDKKFKNIDFFMNFNASNNLNNLPQDLILNSVVVITFNDIYEFKKLKKKLNRINISNVVHLRDFYEVFSPFNNNYKKNKDILLHNRNKINKVIDLFNDVESKLLFSTLIDIYNNFSMKKIEKSQSQDQFFDTNLPFNFDYTFSVIGGIDMDLINKINNNSEIKNCYLFDPDLRIYKDLINELKKSNFPQNKIINIFPMALSNTCSISSFYSANNKNHLVKRGYATGFGSRLKTNGTYNVQTIQLDNIFPINYPTFICLDIEGNELKALKGAKKILSKSSPDLAISLYHKLSDLWEIPLYISEINSNYQLYLRNYTGWGAETVLYAKNNL
jgi:FkbM family methyltransferase